MPTHKYTKHAKDKGCEVSSPSRPVKVTRTTKKNTKPLLVHDEGLYSSNTNWMMLDTIHPCREDVQQVPDDDHNEYPLHITLHSLPLLSTLVLEYIIIIYLQVLQYPESSSSFSIPYVIQVF
jgi:hypothetical protein